MNDPISRRLPEMQPNPQQGAKVTLPSISHVASMARAGPYARPLAADADANGGAAFHHTTITNSTHNSTNNNSSGSSSSSSGGLRPHTEIPLAPYAAGPHATSATTNTTNTTAAGGAGLSPSPPRATGERAEPHDAAVTSTATLHQPLKPKGRAYSSVAAGSPMLSSLVKRRNSSGAQAAPAAPAAPRASTVAKTRSKSTSLSSRAKQRAQSFTYGEPGASAGVAANGKPLNTHSPIAVAAAAAVTSDKISKLLAMQGPLPIRHITSHLSATIPGFGDLSLSKQRRLIIGVLDSPRSDFIKVGWGRWAVRGHTTDSATHRESISSQLPDTKPPLSPGLHAVEDSAVFSDSEDESDAELDNDRLGGRLEDDEVEGTDEEDWRSMGPASLRQTSPREQDAIAALVQLRSE